MNTNNNYELALKLKEVFERFMEERQEFVDVPEEHKVLFLNVSNGSHIVRSSVSNMFGVFRTTSTPDSDVVETFYPAKYADGSVRYSEDVSDCQLQMPSTKDLIKAIEASDNE